MNKQEAKIFAAELKNDLPTIDLHGLYTKDALEKIELFLYEQFDEKNEAVKIIYGGGTGVLQKFMLEYLHNHPLVDTIVEQGGSCLALLISKYESGVTN